jgi:hypothetical protein
MRLTTVRTEAIDRFEVGDLVVRIVLDEMPSDPRENDNIATLVCWHRRYDLGDRKPTEAEERALRKGGFKTLARYLRRTCGVQYVVPVGLIDHSGLHMYVGGGTAIGDAAGWDSGTVGFAYIDPAKAALVGATIDTVDDAVKAVAAEVEEYGQYLEGDVYGYVITQKHCDADDCPHAEVVDSCWGFYGLDYARECARDAALTEAVGVTLDAAL